MHNGAFTHLEDAIRHHLDVAVSMRHYTPANQQLATDLHMSGVSVKRVSIQVDSILLTPISLTNEQFNQLVAFVRYGLLDPRATPERLRRLVPQSVPSDRPMLRFEFP